MLAPSESAPKDDLHEVWTLLRTWHHYEVLKGLGAPVHEVAEAHGALQQARTDLQRCRHSLSS
jgi:hypothetical protein